MIDGAGKAWPPPISTWINNASEAKKAVLDIHNRGYDRLKVYSFLETLTLSRTHVTLLLLYRVFRGFFCLHRSCILTQVEPSRTMALTVYPSWHIRPALIHPAFRILVHNAVILVPLR